MSKGGRPIRGLKNRQHRLGCERHLSDYSCVCWIDQYAIARDGAHSVSQVAACFLPHMSTSALRPLVGVGIWLRPLGGSRTRPLVGHTQAALHAQSSKSHGRLIRSIYSNQLAAQLTEQYLFCFSSDGFKQPQSAIHRFNKTKRGE